MDINENHVSLLARAFENDPFFAHLFSKRKVKDHAKILIRLLILRNRTLDGLILTDHSEMPGYVALLDRPKNIRNVSLMTVLRLSIESSVLAFQIPMNVLRFLSTYQKLTSSSAPNEPHYYLTMIGVDPSVQGKGLGTKVLNEIHTIVDASHPPYPIALDTENHFNVAYYESFGYKLVDTKNIEGVEIFCMTRPASGYSTINH
jgi:GNAT superfamily N-acetyltransferase